jgi:Gpi18-like mannosyltransferase
MCFAAQFETQSVAASRKSLVSTPVAVAAIASLGLYLHSIFWWTEPRDMGLFLQPWFDHIVRYGPVGAFAHPFSNYTPPYLYLLAFASLFHAQLGTMYIIKLLSVGTMAFAAYAVARLIRTCGGKPYLALLLFVLPSTVINSALLAQCDALWAGACVLAVSWMIRGRSVPALAWCGVAFAFKAQAAFIAPFIAGALIGRRPPLWQWTIPALVFVALMIPAVIAGWPAWQIAMVYPGQAGWFDWPGRLANPWMFATVFAPDGAEHFYWLGYAAAVASSVVIASLASSSTQKPRAMLLLALLSALALPYFLPKMLERYFFLADLLSIVLAVCWPARSTIAIAIAVQLASFLSLLSYMYFYLRPYPTLFGALLSTAALIGTFVMARLSGANWPRFNGSAGWQRPASDARTAA